MKSNLVCPMKFAMSIREHVGSEYNCDEDGCAWWDKDVVACAVRVIGMEVGNLGAQGLLWLNAGR